VSSLSFSEGLQAAAARMPQVVREREILRIAASIGGSDGEQAATQARREVLVWAENRTGGRLPPAAWNHEDFEHFAGGRNCSAVRITNEQTDIWAIRADDPDKTVPQRVWTVEASVGYQPKRRPLFSLRLLVSSPEPDLRIEPAIPGLALQVASACGLYRGAEELTAEPWIIESDSDAELLIDMLIDPARESLAFILTVPEYASDPVVPLLDAGSLARATLGMARVIVVPARFTWALTDRFGKRLSVFGGAARVYLPGLTEDANPYGGHELFLADRLATPENGVAARLRQLSASESLRRFRLGREVLSYASVREQSLELKRARLEFEGATDQEQLTAALAQITSLKDDLKKALDEQQWLLEEHGVAEERARGAEAQLVGAGHRIQQLTDQLRDRGDSPDSTIPLPTKWAEFADWCDQNLVGRVLLSPRARREVRAPSFNDISAAARCVLWLANEYRERRLRGGDGDLRIRIEGGFENDRCGADSFQIDWQGVRTGVEWHVKNGGNTRDPSRCMRIYYFWDDATQQVVIASMPGHVHSGAT
jgi:hypothetical protein